MKWYEIGIKIYESILEEPISAFLFESGVLGICLEQKEDGISIKGYISEEFLPKNIHEKVEDFLKHLHSIFPNTKRADFYIQQLKNINWVDNWKKFFSPIHISEKLVIVPPWESTEAQGKHVIKIDPGPAFGTGQHPTTQLCLEAIEVVSSQLNTSWNMLDIGTGTGILAIYGAILGAKEVLALDIDPVALKWAAHNIRLNNVSSKILLSSEPVSKISGNFHIITANLLFDEIKSIISYIPPVMKEWLIVSGILKEQYQDMSKMLKEHKIAIKDIFYKEDWLCAICTKLV